MKYFEVPLLLDSTNYAGPGQSLVVIYIRANDLVDAKEKLVKLRTIFPFTFMPAPEQIFWFFGWIAFLTSPYRDHDIFWQTVHENGDAYNCSASARDLEFS